MVVEPWFWLVAFLLGGGLSMADTGDWVPVLEWMIVVFGSIVIHELGHAFAVRGFGGYAQIAIHTFGGTTFLSRRDYSRGQSIIISAAGPACSLLLALFCAVALYVLPTPAFLRGLAGVGVWVNGIWTVFNLLPVMPMDGGQILRDVLGPRYFRVTCVVGMLTAVLVGVVAFWLECYIAAVLLAFMAYANFKGTS